MRVVVRVCIVLSALSFIFAAFTYLYEARWSGWLPVINYPFRQYSIPLSALGVILFIIGVILHKRFSGGR